LQEGPSPDPISLARRWGDSVLVATPETINTIDLRSQIMTQTMPSPSAMVPGRQSHILTTGDGSFVLLSATGDGALAIFINGNGDPTGALVDFPCYPLEIGDASYSAYCSVHGELQHLQDIIILCCSHRIPISLRDHAQQHHRGPQSKYKPATTHTSHSPPGRV